MIILMSWYIMTGGYPSTAYYHRFIGTVPPLSPPVNALIFFVANVFSYAGSLPRSDRPIFCINSFRCLLWAFRLDVACNDIWCFITTIFTPPHRFHFCGIYISAYSSFRPVLSQVRQRLLSFSPWLFFRPHKFHTQPAPLPTFSRLYVRAYFLNSSPYFAPKPFPVHAQRSIRAAFQGVTPSFHQLVYQLY